MIMNENFPQELLNKMADIEYGWMDKNFNIHKENKSLFSDSYVLQSFEQISKNKFGICWDQVEYEREFFSDNKYKYETYFIVWYNGDDCPTHTFLIYNQDTDWYWFENSWKINRGIHRYNSKNELLLDVRSKFITELCDFDSNFMNLCLYKYSKPKNGIKPLEFFKHAESGENIII